VLAVASALVEHPTLNGEQIDSIIGTAFSLVVNETSASPSRAAV
jgi:hypothetical protein